nr:hypothetical protein Iba_chr04cCG0620 [Ipomoea batatas]
MIADHDRRPSSLFDASMMFCLCPKAETLMYSSPPGPKPVPGTPARLNYTGSAIEAGADNTIEIVYNGRAISVGEFIGHNAPAKTYTSEARKLGERGNFYGNLQGFGFQIREEVILRVAFHVFKILIPP